MYEKVKRRRARNEPFTEAQIWSWLIQLAKGLKALHDNNILHRVHHFHMYCSCVFMAAGSESPEYFPHVGRYYQDR